MTTTGTPYRYRDPSGILTRPTWLRDDTWTDPTTGQSWPVTRWAANSTDTTPRHSIARDGYAAQCGYCWLGASHTRALHDANT